MVTLAQKFVVLVNENDEEKGVMEKMEAHQKGLLHRAYSVFVFNSEGKLLLQQRALTKYHSAGLWTNTCCSHPAPGEDLLSSAENRLREEMGINCKLTEKFSFIYKTSFANGLTEHEYDHVLTGVSNDSPNPDPAEVMDISWKSHDELKALIQTSPQRFTEWFLLCRERAFL